MTAGAQYGPGAVVILMIEIPGLSYRPGIQFPPGGKEVDMILGIMSATVVLLITVRITIRVKRK